MRVSYSALSSFNQCPLKYKWQFVDRVKVPSTPDQFFGGLVHSVLEFALKNGELLPLEKLLEYYKNNWRSDIFIVSHPEQSEGSHKDSSVLPQNDNSNVEQQYYNSGLEMIKNFYAGHQLSQITVLNTEKFFEIYWQDHKIVGKIDRIDKLPTGEIEIIDYKTNKKLPNEDDFKYDWQLPLYAWAAQTLYPCHSEPFDCHSECNEESQDKLREESRRDPSSPIAPQDDNSRYSRQKISAEYNNISSCPPIKLTFHYLRHNKKIAPPNAKTLEELQEFILNTIYKIQASSFLPQTSPLCGWCEYLHLCPEGQEFTNQKSKIKNQNDNSKVNNNEINKSKILNRKSKIAISSDQQSLF